MRFFFTGKNMSVGDALKEKIQHKIKRLEKLFPQDAEVYVTLSSVRHEVKTEVTVPMHRRVLRAEVTANDVNACLDAISDILEKQVIKYKSRLRDKRYRQNATPDEVTFIGTAPEPEAAAPDSIEIKRVKRFELKPMDAQEAVLEMEMLGHDFFVFRSSASQEVNVVYKRNDGEYGLIEPEN